MSAPVRTVHLDEVIDPGLLADMIERGYVRRTPHPRFAMSILNYTQTAQFERVWNEATMQCRGIIVDDEGTVLARPFTKFFNYGEHDALPAGSVTVTDKLDGSLGILHDTPDGPAVATRGSMASDQAVHATMVLRDRYARFAPDPRLTYLFEIIYPQNRIVVDYGGLDDLVLLGAVDTVSGRSVSLDEARESWQGPVVEELQIDSFEAALTAAPRDNREGVVVHFTEADVRVKVKQDDYIRLHRIVTGVSTTSIWEAMATGTPMDELLEQRFDALTAEIDARLASVLGSLPADRTRKDIALSITAMREFPLRNSLFARLDGKPIDRAVWEHIRPEFARPFQRDEDDD
jgi:RNA ligase